MSGDRKLRLLVGKVGLDGHDRGAKIIARAFREAGHEVIYTGLHQTADMVVTYLDTPVGAPVNQPFVVQKDGQADGESVRTSLVVFDSLGTPLTVVPFEEIATVELFRDESFFMDSTIVIELRDGTPISFPVSSESDGDIRFFEAIEDRVPASEE